MKDFLDKCRFAALMIFAILITAFLMARAAEAQVVVQQPTAINPGGSTDFGNGPMELKLTQGAAFFATSSSSGTGQTPGGSSSTALNLTAVPSTPPCVGCILSGTGITSGTTASAYNGVTQITLSAAMSVSTGTTVSWGAACPSSPGISFPLQAAVGGDFPFYTQARVCGFGAGGPGAAALVFPIGAH